MPPPQAFSQEDLVDAATLDRDAFLLVEVGLKPIQRPAAEGQPQAPGIGQRHGDDLGALLRRVGRWAPSPRLILQAVEPLSMEAVNPGVDRGPRDAQVLGHVAGSSSLGDGQEDLGPLDEAGLGRAGSRQVLEGLTLLGGEFAEGDLGEAHGCTSLRSKATPFLRQTVLVSSLAGCTTKWCIRQDR